MENGVRVYHGIEIDSNAVNEIINIVNGSIYSDKIKKFYYKDVVQELLNPSPELVICIGTDWFIQYYDNDNGIDIVDWVSKKNTPDKIKMITEMLRVFRDIFINSNGKMIFGSMRHNTAFQLYYSLLEKGYLDEYEHHINFDMAESKFIIGILNRYLGYLFNKYESLYIVLNMIDDDKYLFAKHQNIILHNIKFKVTDKFIRKYSKKI